MTQLIRLSVIACLTAFLEGLSCRSGGTPPPASVVADVVPPKLLTSTKLPYPLLLSGTGIEGRVTFQVVIDTAGVPEPQTLRILSSPHELLSRAVKTYVPYWRYSPARRGDRKVRVLIAQWVDFSAR